MLPNPSISTETNVPQPIRQVGWAVGIDHGNNRISGYAISNEPTKRFCKPNWTGRGTALVPIHPLDFTHFTNPVGYRTGHPARRTRPCPAIASRHSAPSTRPTSIPGSALSRCSTLRH
jgi:hypothetical protein